MRRSASPRLRLGRRRRRLRRGACAVDRSANAPAAAPPAPDPGGSAARARERVVERRAAVDRGLQQAPRLAAVAALERRDAALQQLLGLPLPLGQRAARPLDVRAGARVAAIEKQRARPDVDRVLVVRGEVVIEAGEQQLLDLRVAIRVRRGVERAWRRRCEADRIMRGTLRRL